MTSPEVSLAPFLLGFYPCHRDPWLYISALQKCTLNHALIKTGIVAAEGEEESEYAENKQWKQQLIVEIYYMNNKIIP